MTSTPNPTTEAWPPDNLADVEELVGPAEIQQLLGVGRQRVYQLTQAKGFPEPVAKLKAGAVWRTTDVVEWARARGREIQED